MVRNIVGTLIEAGKGNVDSEKLRWLLTAPPHGKAGPTAPASGLFLIEVHYGNSGPAAADRSAPPTADASGPPSETPAHTNSVSPGNPVPRFASIPPIAPPIPEKPVAVPISPL